MLNEDIQRLTAAIMDYRQWAESLEKRQGRGLAMRYGQVLLDFLSFAIGQGLRWQQMFTYPTLQEFRSHTQARGAQQALMALGTFLYTHGRIDRPIQITKPPETLPEIYEQHLVYLQEVRELSDSHVRNVRRVLLDLQAYLEKHHLDLSQVDIDQLDAFMATFKVAENTRDIYRYCLRGFLKYLYYDREILKRDLAAMLVAPSAIRTVQIAKVLAARTDPKAL